MKKILIVEDDENIRELLKIYFGKEGFEVVEAEDGEQALDAFARENPHLIILDLMIPVIDGITVAKEIRKKSNVPILMLTAKAEEEDRIKGLEIGADDYVTKPFSPKELVLRVNNIIKRTYPEEQILKFKDLEIHPKEMKVFQNGKEVPFTAKEFKIIFAMVKKPGVVFSRENIMDEIYTEYDDVVFDRTIDVYIKNIRKKLGDNPKNPKYIESVYGAGYRLKK
ncbi:MAG: response regulator transcription factor [Caldisericaceae bacterium]|nr:response regulator transcription factor [Caldisericaceae bacterium]